MEEAGAGDVGKCQIYPRLRAYYQES